MIDMNFRNIHAIGGCGMCVVRNWRPLKELNNLSVGDNIVTMKTRESNECGRGWSIVSGTM